MPEILHHLHPWALIGAAFGCAFYLSSPASVSLLRRAGFGVFSLGAGYAAGVWAYGGGPPYDQGAAGVALLVAAVAVVTLTAFSSAVSSGAGLPPFLSDILDRAPFLNRREPPK